MENLFRTGKTKPFTGAATGESREETTRPPAQSPTIRTGGSHPALAAPVGHPGRFGELGRGQRQRKAFIQYKHSFPLHQTGTANKIKQHPAGYFQATTSFLP